MQSKIGKSLTVLTGLIAALERQAREFAGDEMIEMGLLDHGSNECAFCLTVFRPDNETVSLTYVVGGGSTKRLINGIPATPENLPADAPHNDLITLKGSCSHEEFHFELFPNAVLDTAFAGIAAAAVTWLMRQERSAAEAVPV